jgi:cytochrome b561
MSTTIKLLHWTPRVLCILAILFISMFAMDAFSPNLTFWQQIGAFIIHMVPSFILIAILIVAWKWELIGGIILAVFGLVTTPLVWNINYERTQSVSTTLGVILAITFPFIVIGLLFIASHYAKKRQDHRLIHT